jgi:hypothetical protein
MILTEEEAKTKICQETFTLPQIENYRESGPWNCIASNCMAWRWNICPEYIEVKKLSNTPNGYCGKAGLYP